MILHKEDEHPKGFTVIDNECLTDGLSLRAIGFLAVLLSLPPWWECSVKGFDAILLKDGRTAIASARDELEAAGYIVRHEQRRGKNGQFEKGEWEVFQVKKTKAPRDHLAATYGDEASGQVSTDTQIMSSVASCGNDASVKVSTDARYVPPVVTCVDGTSSQVATDARNVPTVVIWENNVKTQVSTDVQKASTGANCEDGVFAQVATVGAFTADGKRAQLINNQSITKVSTTSSSMSIDDAVRVVVAFVNALTGTSFVPEVKETESLRSALSRGRSVDDCIKAIESCYRQWSTDAKKHLSPRTVFRPDKVDGYIASWCNSYSTKEGVALRRRLGIEPPSKVPQKLPEYVPCPSCGTLAKWFPPDNYDCPSCNEVFRCPGE